MRILILKSNPIRLIRNGDLSGLTSIQELDSRELPDTMDLYRSVRTTRQTGRSQPRQQRTETIGRRDGETPPARTDRLQTLQQSLVLRLPYSMAAPLALSAAGKLEPRSVSTYVLSSELPQRLELDRFDSGKIRLSEQDRLERRRWKARTVNERRREVDTWNASPLEIPPRSYVG